MSLSRGFAVRSMVLGLAAALMCGSADATLLSVDFGPNIAVPHDRSGVEASAAAANAAFAAANVWTGLRFPDYSAAPVVNPVFAGFVDSLGAVTGIRMSFTGALKGFDFTNFYGPSAAPDVLRDDFLFFNSGNNPTTSIDWVLSGLAPSTEYRLYAYGSKADAVRLFDLFVDTNGDGSLVGELAHAIGSTAADRTQTQDAYLSSVFSDATGAIHGRGVGRLGEEANWAGFQLAQVVAPAAVPEPGTVELAAAALAAWLVSRRRGTRRRTA